MEFCLKELRKQKEIKQEGIAEAVGVSPQAVSKWESGGMPDAALLPRIADNLGVTIDALFGREEETLCFEEQFMHQIADIPYSARFHRIFEIARLSSLALMGETHYDENSFSQAEDVYTQIIDDYGILIGRVRTVKNPFLLLLPEPQNGFESAIMPDERMAELFSALGDTNVLKAMFFLQKHEKAFFSVSAFMEGLPFDRETADAVIAKLLALKILKEASLMEGKNAQPIYHYNLNAEFILLLYFAQLMIDPPHSFSYQANNRNRQLFNQG